VPPVELEAAYYA
ncbi:hypothetical protein LDE61_09565, partial [Mycobacterium tuberculosis]